MTFRGTPRRRADTIAGVVVALLVVGPLLAPGFVLVYDMVFVPRAGIAATSLGIASGFPRSVPTDLLVALFSRAVTGQVVQKLVLLAIPGLALTGAARLVPSERLPARLAAGVLYAWNPLVYERLLLGHWALLLGYAVLPWAARAAVDARRGRAGAAARTVLWTAAGAATGPYGGALVALVALAIVVAPPRRPRARARTVALVAAGCLAVNLVWLVPAALHPPVPREPALGQAVFRARADSPLGVVGSVVSLGGLWRTDLAPPGRSGVAWIPAFALVLAIAAGGWPALRSRWGAGPVAGLAAIAIVGAVLAVAPSIAGLAAVPLALARASAAGDVLRDSQKLVIPFALLLTCAFGAGVDRLLAAWPAGAWRNVAAAATVALPVTLAPTLVWAAGGRLHTASYPRSWSLVERTVARDPAPGGVLVLPWHEYLPFAWNHGQTVHDPVAQFLSRPVVGDTSLEIPPVALPPEDPWSRLAAPVATSRGALAPRLGSIGARYVLLFKVADWRRDVPRVAGLVRTLDAPDLALYRANGPAHVPRFATVPAAPVVGGDALALAAVAASAVVGVRSRRPLVLRRRR